MRFGDAKYFMNPEERSKTPVVKTSNAAKMKSFISKEAVAEMVFNFLSYLWSFVFFVSSWVSNLPFNEFLEHGIKAICRPIAIGRD